MLLGKAKLAIISLLCCCALTCVGFSAWTISFDGPIERTVTNGVVTETVMVSDDYVFVKTKDVTVTENGVEVTKEVADTTMFEYGTNCFFNYVTTTENGVATTTLEPSINGTNTTGQIVANFRIKVHNCYLKFGTNTFKAIIALKLLDYSDTGLFAHATVMYNVQASSNSNLVTTEYGNLLQNENGAPVYAETPLATYAYADITLKSDATADTVVDFSVTYDITLPTTSFESYVFNEFKNNGAQFAFEIIITDN